jgi:ribosomal-protein-alanine N-acetyltransferase
MGVRRLLQQYRDGAGVPFVMESDGQIAGQLNVWGIARGSLASATIGYWVSERFAGRGITTTSVALATDICFDEMRLHRMEICIRPENHASLRVVEKLGFRYEGLRRRFIHINGDWRDHYAFALTREDVPEGVLQRWVQGRAPQDAATVPPSDRLRA